MADCPATGAIDIRPLCLPYDQIRLSPPCLLLLEAPGASRQVTYDASEVRTALRYPRMPSACQRLTEVGEEPTFDRDKRGHARSCVQDASGQSTMANGTERSQWARLHGSILRAAVSLGQGSSPDGDDGNVVKRRGCSRGLDPSTSSEIVLRCVMIDAGGRPCQPLYRPPAYRFR
jgi:hypothetical protein